MLQGLDVQEIYEAEDGRVGLEQLAEHDVGLVLTDWNMPGMSGLAFVKAIRAEDAYRGLPVIMVTTEGGERERQEAAEAGATGHIRKPFSIEKMKTSIGKFLV